MPEKGSGVIQNSSMMHKNLEVFATLGMRLNGGLPWSDDASCLSLALYDARYIMQAQSHTKLEVFEIQNTCVYPNKRRHWQQLCRCCRFCFLYGCERRSDYRRVQITSLIITKNDQSTISASFQFELPDKRIHLGKYDKSSSFGLQN